MSSTDRIVIEGQSVIRPVRTPESSAQSLARKVGEALTFRPFLREIDLAK